MFGDLYHSSDFHLLSLSDERPIAGVHRPVLPEQNANMRDAAHSAETQTHSRIDINVTVACGIRSRIVRLRE